MVQDSGNPFAAGDDSGTAGPRHCAVGRGGGAGPETQEHGTQLSQGIQRALNPHHAESAFNCTGGDTVMSILGGKKSGPESSAVKEMTVKNKLGIHARPAAMFVKVANRF